jgi:hypothetical protein
MKLGKNKTIVMWILIALTMILVIYDAWACADKAKRDTISKIVTKSSEKYLVIPFLLGLLMGHFFWSQHLEEKPNGCTR